MKAKGLQTQTTPKLVAALQQKDVNGVKNFQKIAGADSMTPISSLTPQQLALVFAKCKHPGAHCYLPEINCGNAGENIVIVDYGDMGFDFYLDHATVGPVWERDVEQIIKMAEQRNYMDRAYLELLRATKTPEGKVRALCEYWYPNGVPEEMLDDDNRAT